MANRAYITYEIETPRMQKGRVSTETGTGWFPELVGVDGRFTGSLRKFYGFKLVKDLSDIESMTNVDWFKSVVITKGDDYKLRGYLVRHGSPPELTFYYYDTETSSWSKKDLTLDITLSSSTNIDADAYGDYLYVAIEGNTMQLLYWDTDTSSLEQTDVGAGEYYDGGTGSVSIPELDDCVAGGYLNTGGVFEIAYRYYDTDRKIYSKISDTIKITPSDHNQSLSGSEAKIKITIPEPENDAQTLFDSVEIYRTIDLKGTSGTGGTLFLAKTIDMPGSSTTESVGNMLDTALTAQDRYNPEMDVVTSTPKGGAVQLYKGCLFTGNDPNINGGIDIPFSSPYHESYEYFAEDAKYEGNNEDGPAFAFGKAGESLYGVTRNSIIMVKKSGSSVRFQRIHEGRGAVSSEAVHTVGDSILLVTPMGLGSVDGSQSTLQQISSANRIFQIEWKSSLSDIQSAKDSPLGCSFFLNPTKDEILAVWHATASLSFLKKTGFTACTSGVNPTSGGSERAFFITVGGRIVTPDNEETGSGSMWDLDGTLQGVTSEASSNYKLIDSTATFNDDVEGAAVYFPTSRTWASVNSKDSATQLTLDIADIEDNVPYVINGVLFGARCWNIPLTNQEGTLKLPFTRRNLTSITCDFVELSGFSNIEADKVLVGAYRNGSSSLATNYTTKDIDDNPADMAIDLHVDGIQVEPYVEQMSVGTKFELTMLDAGVTIGDSRKVDD